MKPAEFRQIEDAVSYIKLLGKPIPELPPLSLYKPPIKSPVIGDPTREPIDSTARRVIAPCPEQFKPPPEPANNIYKNMKEPINSERTRNENSPVRDEVSRAPSNTFLVGKKKEADFDIEVTNASTKTFAKNVSDTENLVKRAEEARAAIEYLCTHVKVAWAEYEEYVVNCLKQARATKAAIEIETRLTLSTLGDVRKFFLDPRHEEEVQRLKEFVQLCERLRELKADGFLDAVSDTILRLEMGNPTS